MADSRIEAILGNILGEDNEILEPFSRNEALLLQIGEKIDNAPDTVITTSDINTIINGIW